MVSESHTTNRAAVSPSRVVARPAGRTPSLASAARASRPVQQHWYRRLAKTLWSMPPLIKLAFIAAVLIVLAALAAPWLSAFDTNDQSLVNRLAAPGDSAHGDSRVHWLGTDQLGRDILSRVLHGARISLGISIIGTLISFTMGSALGLISGFAGKRADTIVMFGVDTQQALPFIVIALASIAIFGTQLSVLIILLGISGWDTFARFARGMTLGLRSRDYVTAAQVMGQTMPRILIRHVLPNIAAPLVILATLNMTSIIMLESSLSFLGLGVQPPMPSWGSMIGDGRQYLNTGAWWLAIVPGAAIILTTISINLLGDWLRDVLDPTLKGGR